MIKRDALILFMQLNQQSINDCQTDYEQAELWIRFLNRLNNQKLITVEQINKWS